MKLLPRSLILSFPRNLSQRKPGAGIQICLNPADGGTGFRVALRLPGMTISLQVESFARTFLRINFLTLFQKYVLNQFQAVIRTSAESQPRDKISPWTTGLPEIPPAPLYQRGVGGDFRDELAIQNSLPNLEFLDVDPAYRLITYL